MDKELLGLVAELHQGLGTIKAQKEAMAERIADLQKQVEKLEAQNAKLIDALATAQQPSVTIDPGPFTWCSSGGTQTPDTTRA